jgi:hypothetical protein
MNNDDDYNVNNYTDNELYDILELVNPSDSILEAKIIQMINKFKTINNRYGHTLATFFTNIYKHFFDVPIDQDEIEGFENIDSKKYDNTKQKFIEDTDAPTGIAYETDLSNLKETSALNQYKNNDLAPELQNIRSSYNEKTKKWDASPTDINEIVRNNDLQLGFKETSSQLERTNAREFKQIDYLKGTLNPLIKQTIKRIISIDSQYRETRDKISTEFTFNLSEPLRNVVALRLYSIQIPFTWYTVGNNYGANYLYYKGKSPGINNGNFDYKIEIPPGNYTNQTIVDTLNTRFQSLKTEYTDVSFGTTQITYNQFTCKSTITTDIKNLFNESNYEIIFQIDDSLNKYPLVDLSGNKNTTTQNDQLRYLDLSSNRTSLFAYLGFDNNNYRVNALYSNTHISISVNTSIYTINNNNNSFIIKRRDARNIDVSDNIIIKIPTGPYTVTGIIDAINLDISNNPRLISNNSPLSNSTFKYNPSRLDSKKENEGNQYYEIQIYFNKNNDPFANVSGLTTYIQFPNESTSQTNVHVWTGPDSLFKFNTFNHFSNDSSYNDFNEIIAESQSYQTDYIISGNPYIVLKCINTTLGDNSTTYAPTNGTRPQNTTTPSKNDFIIDISNSDLLSTGYNFDEYLNAIQFRLDLLKNDNENNAYDIYNLNNKISYDSALNKVVFSFNMDIGFSKNRYKIKLGTIFKTLGNFDTSNNISLINDLSATTKNYITPELKNNEIIATIYPDSSANSETVWTITNLAISASYDNKNSLISAIQKAFTDFTLPDRSKPISLQITAGIVDITPTILSFNISRKLSQKDYDVYFYDTSGNNESSWNKYLFFDNLYNLEDASYNADTNDTTITSNSPIGGYTFFMDKDTQFTIKGLNPGLTSSKNENDIIIKIPAPTNTSKTYTRQEIFNIINNQFDANIATRGSLIYYQTNPGTTNQYVHMKIKINKIFSALDYSVVMYDTFSFVKCFVGTKSVRNVTLDSTLGWLLGFRSNPNYDLIETTKYSDNSYTLNEQTNIVTITSDTTMTTNIYDYFLIILDDYTQSHLNDGLVTIIPKDQSIPLPSYAQTVICNNSNNNQVTDTTGNVNRLTEKQLYAANTILTEKAASKSVSSGPSIQDVFGLIPLKLGIPAGATYVEFGGTLQNQERVYFGPVNISRMTIKLINDRGEPVDLNGANWSFSFICEQLYDVNDGSNR